MMTRAQGVAIATAVQQVRPEWDHPGILAALHAAQGMGSPAEVAAAAFRLAGDLKARTPGLLPKPGSHWRAPAEGGPTVSVIATRCGEHPAHLARACPDCAAEVAGVDHAAHAADLRRQLRATPRLPATEADARTARKAAR